MKTLHVVWVAEKYNTVTDAVESAHAEVWTYETPGPKYGTKVLPLLEGWTEDDCKRWAKAWNGDSI
tara:strand:- start:233 stop:430 length:198 start_codon:yes stop_codon:yes gene_type:complete